MKKAWISLFSAALLLLYAWEDGILFTVTGSAEDFEAQKWRTPLGAYFFLDCTAEQAGDGSWSYTVGAQAIS